MKPGENGGLTAEVKSMSVEDPMVLWVTDNPNVAVVDDDGKVYAVHKGVAHITSITGYAEANYTVYVDMQAPDEEKEEPADDKPDSGKKSEERSSGSSRNEISTHMAVISSGSRPYGRNGDRMVHGSVRRIPVLS